jgi:hypothetical protein
MEVSGDVVSMRLMVSQAFKDIDADAAEVGIAEEAEKTMHNHYDANAIDSS